MEPEDFHLGADVYSSDGKHIGSLVHVLVDSDYHLKSLVIKESGPFSGHALSPGSFLVNDEFIVPIDAAKTVTHDHVELTLTALDARRLPPYLAYREKPESVGEELEDEAGILGTGPAIPHWMAQVANKPATELEIDRDENVMLGHTGKKLGAVKDVLFDDGALVGVVLKPEGLFKKQVILPRRYLDRSDDAALFAQIEEADLERLTPFQPPG
ncbi:MAG TPA: PRC-barrel domain-containing protein [Candidatus Dormibacteraeota bacterium]|nr:PRC-barrel domain-containing protein [Candidatus Dormibacteraeota bacterium]